MNNPKFRFDLENHLYFLEVDGVEKPLTGVTTVLSVIAKPTLISWAANMACDYIKNSPVWRTDDDTGNLLIGNKDLETILAEARLAHRRKKEEAGMKGTDVHTIIENYIKEAIKDEEGYIPILGDDEKNEQVRNFVKWAIRNNVKFLESEKRLYSEKYWIAGTCDFTCEINGKKYVGDAKTGNVFDRIPFFQVSAYRFMLEEMKEKDYFGSVIVNIKKDGKFDEEKDVMWSFDYQTDLDGFLAALKIYRILNNY